MSGTFVEGALRPKLAFEVYIDQKLMYHIKDANIFDENNRLVTKYISTTHGELKNSKEVTSVYKILGLNLEGNAIQVKISGSDAQVYTIKCVEM